MAEARGMSSRGGIVVALLVAACGGATKGGAADANASAPSEASNNASAPSNAKATTNTSSTTSTTTTATDAGAPDVQTSTNGVAVCAGTSGDTRSSLTVSYPAFVDGFEDGQDVMFETGLVGYSIAVSQSCSFQVIDWARGRVLSGVLDDAERRAWTDALPLARLGELGPKQDCEFVPPTVSFGGVDYVVSCGDAAAAVRKGIEAIRARIDKGIVPTTMATSGVRFAVVLGPDSSDGEDYQYSFGKAPLWPLATEPGALLDGNRVFKGSAEGADAAALRAIRESYYAGEAGYFDSGSARVVDHSGHYFRVWVRDRLPGEK